MITLTDGKKKVKLTKEEMKTIENALRDNRDELRALAWMLEADEINAILTKLEGLNYE